ncbi:hypothetical protein [Pseudactinotalea terrae]|uniref:hypothetical protein n=1 Tax=Pseudactinotalea terrae TaxID=1743262 RepID=UPI0012E27570|nr:hypothetical protein [Pseudactinotalea terrae]
MNVRTRHRASDRRTHRIGQTRSVMVYRLVAAHTIEAEVLGLSARKGTLFANVLDGGAAGSAQPGTSPLTRSGGW